MITVERIEDVLLADDPFEESSDRSYTECVKAALIKIYAQRNNLVIGSHVKLKDVGLRHGGYGMAVAIVDEHVTVLWSIEPIHSNDPLKSFVFPVVRQQSNYLVAQQLVSIQPMSMPSGLVFYMDHTYGSGSLGTSSLGEA